MIMDLGVIGKAGIQADFTRAEIADEGGTALATLLENPTREVAGPVMVNGCIAILKRKIERDEVHAVMGLGGTQGTTSCCNIMQALPYGFPKIMISTIASGDTSSFVGIKDITMMFSVSDILKLNPFTRKILSNGVAAACGMAATGSVFELQKTDKPLIGMTNLGVVTKGTIKAINYFEEKGYEVIVFHRSGFWRKSNGANDERRDHYGRIRLCSWGDC